MVVPSVVGFKLVGKLRVGVTITDLVRTVTQMLRKHGVFGTIVEFYGEINIYLIFEIVYEISGVHKFVLFFNVKERG